MRGFKYISICVVLLSLVATTVPLLNYKSIDDDIYFKHQLDQLRGISAPTHILIYGSSGLLFGINAKSLELKTGTKSINLSTAGFAQQFDIALRMVNSDAKGRQIILVGDRDYRNSNLLPSFWQSGFKKITSWIDLTPNLVALLRAEEPFFPRDTYGDLSVYPKSAFVEGEYGGAPVYDSSNVELMLRQASLIKQSGHCPILVLVPLLVKNDEQDTFINATNKLFEMADSAGLSDNLVHAPVIETDKNLFIDQTHMSEAGRDKWTNLIANEMKDRNMCNVNVTSHQNDKLKP